MRSKISRCIRMTAALAFVFFFTLAANAVEESKWDIRNPYEAVDWERDRPYKANFHTHTTMSDGSGSPDAVIDRYAALGYSVLSLTDHSTMGPNGDRKHPERHKTTWPWSAFGRNPETVNMIAIEGNEISGKHDIGSYFSDYGARPKSEKEALEEIGRRKGLAVMFHPGRYDKSVEWYVDLFRSYPQLIGLEIFNQGDRFPGDRKTWDAILTELIQERPVWGFSNDDMHDPKKHLGRNWNVLILPELTEKSVRDALEKGAFFYVFAPDGHQGESPPQIKSVIVDSAKGVLRLHATGCLRIEWISKGEIVQLGDSIDVSSVKNIGGYVRAVIHGVDGKTLIGTQPFRIEKSKP